MEVEGAPGAPRRGVIQRRERFVQILTDACWVYAPSETAPWRAGLNFGLALPTCLQQGGGPYIPDLVIHQCPDRL